MNMKENERQIGLGLWGANGHQIHGQLDRYPRLKLVAFGGFGGDADTELQAGYPQARQCNSLEELLEITGVELVSLCSPLRTNQVDDTILALGKGIHVYAEKPCATTEADLDRLVVGDADRGPIDTSAPAPDWLDCVIAHIAEATPMPFDLEAELHPTRMVLRAKAVAANRTSNA
jgi:predicted dehydrogenase